MFRPIINNKFEDKTCGDGPSLISMFQDDRHLQALVDSVKVNMIDARCFVNAVYRVLVYQVHAVSGVLVYR